MKHLLRIGLVAALLGTALSAQTKRPAAGPAPAPTPAQEWTSYFHDLGGQRFSPLKQITPANVNQLQLAWSYDTEQPGLQNVPIVAKGVMFITYGKNVAALAADTGAVVWKFVAPAVASRRGVSYWPGDATHPARIVTGSGDKMMALDAATGQIVPGFGVDGYVDLRQGITGDTPGNISLASPPTIFRNMIITGGNNGEGSPSKGLYGDIRAWDVITGKMLWAFHTVPRAGEPGVDTWAGDSWKDRSGTNVWSYFAIDEQRGIIYAPTGVSTSDYYGGDRHGMNLYGNSLIAIDAVTGKMKWFHQIVHHDLWDFDLPAGPTLITVHRNGRAIPAVAVITKMGMLFIYNRVTGEPVFGVEERPVPKSNVPGEESWPTQPFPVKPEPLSRMTFDPAKDFINNSPETFAYCKDLWAKNNFYTQGPYTPAGTEGQMVNFPSTIGGGNWNGTYYDESLGLVFTNVMNLGQVAKMVQGTDRSGAKTWVRQSPWGGAVGRFWNPDTKIPCSAGPWGQLVAVNVNTGDVAWKSTLGFTEALKEKGVENTGALNQGGGIATAGGLIFIGATTDKRFRAFESKTGKQVWETELEASAHDVPVSYLGRDGRQYVAVVAGGGSYLNSPGRGKVMVYALPAPAKKH